MVQIQSITYEQAKLKSTHSAKRWLKDNGYTTIKVHCTRGTFHVINTSKHGSLLEFMLSAKYILEQATGYTFTALNGSMARLNKEQFI